MVVIPDGETEEFVIHAGVLQEDTLAPFLFVIVLDYILLQDEELGFTVTPRRSRQIPGKAITDLDFADDIALLSNDLEQAQRLLSNVEEECKRVGLHLNASKTKVLSCNTLSQNPLATSNGNILEQVHDFKYLGSWVSSTEHDIKVRKALAWKALNTMSKVWKSGISKDLKRRLFVATVESVLLYSCKSWSLTSTLERSVDGTYTWMLCAALEFSWQRHTPNEVLYGSLPRVSDKIAWRRLGLAGHCFRHSPFVLEV